MDPGLEAILAQIAESIALLTLERARSRRDLRSLAAKLTQIDRRLAKLEKMVRN